MLTSSGDLGNSSSPRRCSDALCTTLAPLFLTGDWSALDPQPHDRGAASPSPPRPGRWRLRGLCGSDRHNTRTCCFHRWQLNGSDIDLRAGDRYELHGGTLVVSDPRGSRDAGTYRCLATNSLGTIVSREARLQFACRCGWPRGGACWGPRGVISVSGPTRVVSVTSVCALLPCDPFVRTIGGRGDPVRDVSFARAGRAGTEGQRWCLWGTASGLGGRSCRVGA